VEKPRCRRTGPIPSHRKRVQVRVVCSIYLPFINLLTVDYSPQHSEDRVRKGAEKLAKFLNTKQQGRLDGFFTVQPKTSPKKGSAKTSGKDVKGKGKGKGKGKADAKGTKRKVRIFFALCV
jgi:hypothetical protein